MTIRQTTTTINVMIIGIVCLIGLLVFHLYTAVIDNNNAYKQQKVLDGLALELQQSSEALTRQVRTYAATSDPAAEQKYLDVVKERAGTIPRAQHRTVSPGEKVSLLSLLQREGANPTELAKVQQANKLSDALIALETEAMHAVKGQFKDSAGQYTVQRAPDAAYALQLVFSPAYAAEVTKIMAPLKDFFAMLDQRMVESVVQSSLEVQRSMYAVAGGLVFMLLLCSISTWYNHVYVSKPLAQTVNYAQKVLEDENTAPLQLKINNEIGVLVGVLNTLLGSLQKELAFSRGVFAALPVAYAVFNNKNEVELINQRTLDLLGHEGPTKNYLGLTSGELMRGNAQTDTVVNVCLNSGKFSKMEREFTNFAGKNIYLEALANPLYDPSGKLSHVFAVWLDNTELASQKAAIEQHQKVILQVAQNTVQVVDDAQKISEVLAGQIARADQATEETAGRMRNTAAAMDEMNTAVLEVAKNASDAAISTEDMRSKANEGSTVVARMVSGMNGVQKNALNLSTDMQHLNELTQGITKILVVISDIADQTNLLALNAAIEAARAGDAGRGFAVVADEVRKLAEKTMTATTEVSAVITNIQNDTTRNVDNVHSAVRAIEEVTALATASGNTLEEIVSLARQAADMVRAIATASEQQSASSAQVSDSVAVVSDATAQIATAMNEANHGMEGLEQQMEKVLHLVQQLKGEES